MALIKGVPLHHVVHTTLQQATSLPSKPLPSLASEGSGLEGSDVACCKVVWTTWWSGTPLMRAMTK